MASQSAEMSEEQRKHMLDALTSELSTVSNNLRRSEEEQQAALDKARELSEAMAAKEKYYKEIEDKYNRAQEAVSKKYTDLVNSQVLPYLHSVKQFEPERASDIDRFSNGLQRMAKDIFGNPENLACLETIRAAASANQVTSSKLEEMFQSQQQWESKLAKLQEEHDRVRAEAERNSELVSDKEKLLAELKAELEQLRTKAREDVSDPENHFTAAAPAVTATASAAPRRDIGSLFNYTPRTDWRSAVPK